MTTSATDPLTSQQRRTLALYNALVEEREQDKARRAAEAAADGRETDEETPAPANEAAPLRRLRHTRDPKTGRATIDLSKADPDCERCNGTGRLDDKLLDDPESDGGIMRVPVVCVCVHRGGGVKRDALDKLLDKAAKQARWEERRKQRRRERTRARKAKRRKRRS